MTRNIDYIITEADEGLTVGAFLRQKGYSEKLITAFRKSPEALFVGDTPAKTIRKLIAGDTLHVCIEEKAGVSGVIPKKPEVMPQIIYEDEDILVINKPQRMPVHPSMEHYEDTLANAVMWYLGQSGPAAFRIINRLDKDTSGLTLIAKNRLSAGILSASMVRRQIHRTYLALCDGLVPENGIISAPIARLEGSVLERCVDFEKGEPAVTHFERLEYKSGLNASLVRLRLETGRTHQIRVHMKYIGHPLLGDFLYNPGDVRMPYQALHSAALTFNHPITGEEMKFSCPVGWDPR